MKRAELNAAQHALNETIKRYTAAGLDAYALNAEAERLAAKANRLARDGEKPVHHRRLMEQVPDYAPAPERTLTPDAEIDDGEQRAYEAVYRLLNIAITATIQQYVPHYGPRRVRVAMNGALRRMADTLPSRDEFRHEREIVDERMLRNGR